jgi:RNA polymerase sigma-70 factor, ECF subfamily
LKVRKNEANERLLVEAARRDPARFADLYEEHFERVYAFVACRVQDRPAAEDVTSDVFHQALANLKNYEWRGVPFAAWLYRIAANAIADRWQRLARESGNPSQDDPPDEHKGVNPEQIERRAQLFRLVRTLPSEQRRVIELRFAEGKSIREIASELKRTAGAIKQLQFRGIQTLRAQLGKGTRKKLGGSNG